MCCFALCWRETRPRGETVARGSSRTSGPARSTRNPKERSWRPQKSAREEGTAPNQKIYSRQNSPVTSLGLHSSRLRKGSGGRHQHEQEPEGSRSSSRIVLGADLYLGPQPGRCVPPPPPETKSSRNTNQDGDVRKRWESRGCRERMTNI